MSIYYDEATHTLTIRSEGPTFAERAVKWDQDTYVSRRMAVSHFFGAPAAPKKA